jgi:hypothetical protein
MPQPLAQIQDGGEEEFFTAKRRRDEESHAETRRRGEKRRRRTGPRKVVHFTYTDDGVERHGTETVEKDADSGLWIPGR